MIKTYFFVLLCLTFSSFFGQNVYKITDPEALEALNLQAGDEVVLANGTYSSDDRILFSGIGTVNNPITFRSETPGGVVFNNGLKLNIAGQYLVVDGFYWNGGYGASNFIQFRNGTTYSQNCTIQNCAINGLVAEPADAEEAAEEGAIIKHRWIVLYGNYNSVLNCTFMNKNTAGALILAEYEYNASPDDGVTSTRCVTVGHTISNNYFFNYEKIDATLSNAGDSETIRIGTSEYQNVNSAAVISGNYFVEADGENEIITNKSANNSYLNNTFRRCRGSLVLRHGANAIVSGNYFLGENVEGTGGIRITDSNHTITHNYIQDCVNKQSNAIWNNGLTFVGGNTNSVQNCNLTSVSNGYQDVENINFSNNTFINTNSPILFNDSRNGADYVYGTLSNNLIYFEDNNENISNIITGSYTEIGNRLNFYGNIYDGTTLGQFVEGFTSQSIAITPNGEIYTHNASNKGASITNNPITDSMVGYGVGACFLDFEAKYITNSNCAIAVVEPVDTLIVNSVATFSAEAANVTTNVLSNISWQALPNNNWITVSPAAANGSGVITISVEKNPEFEPRTGSITFSAVNGDLGQTLYVTQNGMEITDTLNLINTGVNGNPVSAYLWSKEEVNDDFSKTNYAINTLDKNTGTVWAADDLEGDGEYIIYDLGEQYTLDLIELSTDGKSDAYGFQVWVSTTNTEENSFTKILPQTDGLLYTAAGSKDFNEHILDGVEATYVKLVVFGRFNTSGNKTSNWTNISEINFYGNENMVLNKTDNQAKALNVSFFPNPVTNGTLNINADNSHFKTLNIYSLGGQLIYKTKFTNTVNLAKLSAGIYFVEIGKGNEKVVKRILVK